MVIFSRTQGKGKEILFDAEASPEITQKVVAPEEQQSPNESRRLVILRLYRGSSAD